MTNTLISVFSKWAEEEKFLLSIPKKHYFIHLQIFESDFNPLLLLNFYIKSFLQTIAP